MDRQRYYQTIAACRTFSKDEERELWQRCHAGNNGCADVDARRLLIESMLRFVLKWVLEWVNRRSIGGDGRLVSDLLGEANLTLIDVVDHRFHPDKGRLGTILVYYLHRNLRRYLFRQSIIAIPEYYINDVKNRKRGYRAFANAAIRPMISIDESTLVDYHNDDGDGDGDDDVVLDREYCVAWICKAIEKLGDVPTKHKRIYLEYLTGDVTQKSIDLKYAMKRAKTNDIVKRVGQKLREVYLIETQERQHEAKDE